MDATLPELAPSAFLNLEKCGRVPGPTQRVINLHW